MVACLQEGEGQRDHNPFPTIQLAAWRIPQQAAL